MPKARPRRATSMLSATSASLAAVRSPLPVRSPKRDQKTQPHEPAARSSGFEAVESASPPTASHFRRPIRSKIAPEAIFRGLAVVSATPFISPMTPVWDLSTLLGNRSGA